MDSADVIMMDEQNAAQEPTYTIEELKAASRRFGYSAAMIVTALELTGRDRFTLAEAKAIVEEMATRPITR